MAVMPARTAAETEGRVSRRKTGPCVLWYRCMYCCTRKIGNFLDCHLCSGCGIQGASRWCGVMWCSVTLTFDGDGDLRCPNSPDKVTHVTHQ